MINFAVDIDTGFDGDHRTIGSWDGDELGEALVVAHVLELDDIAAQRVDSPDLGEADGASWVAGGEDRGTRGGVPGRSDAEGGVQERLDEDVGSCRVRV